MSSVHLALEPTSSGAWTIRASSPQATWYLHSRYDPVAESRRWATGLGVTPGEPLLVYVLGLGYHVEALVDTFSPPSVLVLEQSTAVARLAERLGVLDRLRTLGVELVIEPDWRQLALRLRGAFARMIDDGGILLIHPPSLRLIPEEAADLRDALERWMIFLKTRERFKDALEQNLTNNLPRIRTLPRVGRLAGRFTGIPGFLIAAGPSLDEALPHLSRAKERGLLLAVGTALRPLATAGVTPHLAMMTDPSPALCLQFEGLTQLPPLVVFPTVHPAVLSSYPGPLLLALQRGIEETERLAAALREPLLPTGGSVATAAFSLLRLLGCDPIVLVGLDLAWTGGRTHARATPAFQWNRSVTRLTPANDGRQVPTTGNLQAYRGWFEAQLARLPAGTVYNTALHGARIRGTEVRPLLEVLSLLTPLPIDLEPMIAAALLPGEA